MKKIFTRLYIVASLLIAVPALAFVGGQMGYNCPYCGMRSNYGSYAMPSFYPANYPWWAGYGAMTYPNFYYPTAWNGGGVNPSYFPGQGRVYAGKPNIYISGKAGTTVKVKLDFPADSNLLGAVPSHGQTGWEGVLQPSESAAGEKVLRSAGADYRYIFYDFRFNENKVQDEAGFCVSRQELIPRMKKILSTARFHDNEIKDFETYWSVKIPPSSQYCVYPQTGAELDKAAPLRITPTPSRVRRVGFVIAIKEGLVDNGRKFTRKPTQAWSHPDADRAIASSPVAGAEPGLEVREWGVIFVQDPLK